MFNKIKLYLQKNENIILLIILLASFIIRLKYFSMNSAIWWDEGDYLSTAKRWGGLSYLEDTWYYRRTPFLPLLWAGLYRLGATETILRITELVFSTLLILGIYLLAKEMFNNKVIGLIAAGSAVFNKIHLFLTTRLLTEIPSTTFLVFGLYFFWRGYIKKEKSKYIYLAALFLSLAIMTRMATFLVLIPLTLYILIKEKKDIFKNKQIWISLLIIAIIMSPFIFLYKTHVGGVSDFLRHYTVGEESSGSFVPEEYLGLKGIWLYFMSHLIDFGYLLFIVFVITLILYIYPLILGIDLILKNEELKEKLLVLLIILIPIIYHGIFSLYVEERYLLWSFPVIYALIGFGLYYLYEQIKKYSKNIAIAALLVLIFVNSYLIYQDTNIFPRTIEEFEEEIKKTKPKYILISFIEQTKPWMQEIIQVPPPYLRLENVFTEQQPLVFVFRVENG